MVKKKRRIPRAKIEEIAIALHQLISYTTLAIMGASHKVIDPNTSEDIRALDMDLLDNMLDTAQTLYDDLDSGQKKFLRNLARALTADL